jgi:hypothetical protein
MQIEKNMSGEKEKRDCARIITGRAATIDRNPSVHRSHPR